MIGEHRPYPNIPEASLEERNEILQDAPVNRDDYRDSADEAALGDPYSAVTAKKAFAEQDIASRDSGLAARQAFDAIGSADEAEQWQGNQG